ncbi:MAG: P-II family nitrogen regulator, partial [Sulfurimonas sp.]
MITVMLYGFVTEQMGIRGDREKEQLHLKELRNALEDANNMGLATIHVQGTDKHHSEKIPFSAVHVVVPTEKTQQALEAARKAGARGVTIMSAHGMGLEKMDNFYARLQREDTDANLMFLTPTKKVDAIIKSIMDELDITGSGAGLAFSYPISHMKGISLKIDDL